jgi:hypothetical protein
LIDRSAIAFKIYSAGTGLALKFVMHRLVKENPTPAREFAVSVLVKLKQLLLILILIPKYEIHHL